MKAILVDVIIPVHNASDTIEETVQSALNQTIPQHLKASLEDYSLKISVCCYDDGSTDNSWPILQQLQATGGKASPNRRLVSDVANGEDPSSNPPVQCISSSLLIKTSPNGVARGAGYARNRAVELPRHYDPEHRSDFDQPEEDLHFLCLLDSDDTMHPHRIAEQTCHMLSLPLIERQRTLLGCQFDRDPPDSTWHYSQWANSLDDERLSLERFREITVLQPTWFLTWKRFCQLGGYVEAPLAPSSSNDGDTMAAVLSVFIENEKARHDRLVHPAHDTLESLRLAEDLRFFHDHLSYHCRHPTVSQQRDKETTQANAGEDILDAPSPGSVGADATTRIGIQSTEGLVRLHRVKVHTHDSEMGAASSKSLPLVTYRHMGDSSSQSFRTSRKLLLQLRVWAFERSVLNPPGSSTTTVPSWASRKTPPEATVGANQVYHDDNGQFVIWGAGRDGKDFLKALSSRESRERVYCFVDVDEKKLAVGTYQNRDLPGANNIPVVHFSFLVRDPNIRKRLLQEWQSSSVEDEVSGRINKKVKTTFATTTGTSFLRATGTEGSTDEKETPDHRRKRKREFKQRKPLDARGLDEAKLQRLPVVVCVAMYRTGGALERNVSLIGRTEGKDLWHFS